MTNAKTTNKVKEDKTFKTVQDTVEKTVKAAQKTVEENVQKAVKEATSNLDNVTEFSKANYEALVASGNAAVKVAQSVNAEFMEKSKKAVERNVADTKALFAAKTPAEFFELQANIFKTRYEEIVSESTRVNEFSTTTGADVVAPLKARYEEVATKYNLPLVG
ncbi:hypothetical protein MNBD_ALPHA02-320 [hydrothermal vent metagenome]|uniref:Phasin domain-containing protein n=1 Tax=hydrothermal vent metagenome TaxID=652676 RepID=A0A3B0RDK1_9ZZZZ